MSNSSGLFSYATICSSFKWVEPLFFELSCTQTHTHRQTDRHTDRHTDGHEYSIVINRNYDNGNLVVSMNVTKLISIYRPTKMYSLYHYYS